jgi:hypothetical protein
MRQGPPLADILRRQCRHDRQIGSLEAGVREVDRPVENRNAHPAIAAAG